MDALLRATITVWLLTSLAVAFKYKDHARYKRQLGEIPQQTIGLNTTVPYIFSARLYPFGEAKGDRLLQGEQAPLHLLEPFVFLGSVFDTLYIRSDGALSMSPVSQQPSVFPSQHPLLAVYWMATTGGKVYYRQTEDPNILNLAHNEVNIQYRYGRVFNIRSVVVVTWDGVKDKKEENSDGNVFQIALLIGDEMTFAHIIYSKLNTNNDAVAGFSNGLNTSYSLPDSGTPESMQLKEKSDIGIPGEWLFRVDTPQVLLCGAGFKGLECVESCSPSQWFNDCSRSCHCENGDQCDPEDGHCPTRTCSPGWTGTPTCDRDIDECLQPDICPNEQPDCVNTPGAFMCLCFEYDEEKKACKGSDPQSSPSEAVPVEVVPLRPRLHAQTQAPLVPQGRGRFGLSSTSTEATPPTTTTVTSKPSKSTKPVKFVMATTTVETSKPTTAPTTTESEKASPFIVPQEVMDHVLQPSKPNTTVSCANCSPLAVCHSGRCECVQGYSGDGVRCEDINECQDPQKCGEHASCENTIGGYECTCDEGYRFEEAKCVDKNECLEGTVCGDGIGAECVNTIGSFSCQCKDGYIGNPLNAEGCQDIDECSAPEPFCGKHATCTNTVGGFECECLEGFERETEESFCTDIDECLLNPCHPAAVCSNLLGSFTCQCIEGFIGNGVNCHETILFPIANDSFVVPRSETGNAKFHLEKSIRILGEDYQDVYVSPNGIVAFVPLSASLIEDPLSLHGPSIFALHVQYDYTREGLVAYTHVNESDPASSALLIRSTLSVQNQLHLKDFHARELHIFTFDNMRQMGTDNVNSFQIVLSYSPPTTVVTLIYEKAEAKGAIVGIATKKEFHELPPDVLGHESNVGQPGKWMLVIDNDPIEGCPAGTTQPPYCKQDCPMGHWGLGCVHTCNCQSGIPCDVASGVCATGQCQPGFQGPNCDEDIDECATGIVTCHHNSTCRNMRGSFECVCAPGYRGNGTNCQPIGLCESRFSRPCARDAECVDVNGEPVCQCIKGYQGDGFRCEQLQISTVPTEVASGAPNQRPHLIIPQLQTVAPAGGVDEDMLHPFVMKNWVTEPVMRDTTRTPALGGIFAGKKQPIPTPPRNNFAHNENTSENGEKENNVEIVEEKRDGDDDGETGTLLLIMIPTALCGIWCILFIVVIALCFRGNRNTSPNRKSIEQWHAPPRHFAPHFYPNSLPSAMPPTGYA